MNSGIGEQDLDTELLKIASAREDFCIDIPGFIALLQPRCKCCASTARLDVFSYICAYACRASPDCGNIQ